MSTLFHLETALMTVVDAAMAAVPRRPPAYETLAACKVIAHRGAPSFAAGIKENTLKAFDRASDSGAWGIELDVRFTRDDVPVVIHDPSASRVFSQPVMIEDFDSRTLAQRCPELPTLSNVIERFGGRMHLMIELKRLQAPLSPKRLAALKETLSPLKATTDFHLIALDASVLAQCQFVPREALVPVSEFNVSAMSRDTLEKGFGGIAGSYALISSGRIHAHHVAGQKVGTGFVGSRGVLFRELARGVDWIFTNDAPELMSILRRELAARAPAKLTPNA